MDLIKLLKGQEGIELYSPIFGEGILDEVNENLFYSIIVKDNSDEFHHFTKEGYYTKGEKVNPECLLFPSKENRDWNNFSKWRAKNGGKYYYIKFYNEADVEQTIDTRAGFDEEKYKSNNYFKTEEKAQIIASAINNLFK